MTQERNVEREASLRATEQALQSFEVVRHPDHPLLLSGPDVLAGANGRLIAVYLPTVRETRSADRLVARLMLARLALPEHTEHVVVTNPEKVGPLVGAADFDDVVDDREIASLRTGRTIARSQVPSETRRSVRNRFARISTDKVQRSDRRREAPPASDDWWTRRRPSFIEPDNGRLLLHLEDARTRAAARERVVSALLEGVLSDFALDGGRMFSRFSDELPIHVTLGAFPQSQRFDHHKLRRAAAFAGWRVSVEAL